MRIAICSVGELYGGVERQILDLCRFYGRRGLPTPLVILFFDRTLAANLREQGIEPVIIRGRSRYDWSVIGEIARHLTAHRTEVLHVHGYKATIAGGLAAARVGCRVLKTEHGKREGTLAHPLTWLKTRLNFQFEQWLTRRHVDHVCYVTHDIAQFFSKRHEGLARSTIHNGIDPLFRAAYERPPDLPDSTFNVGIVGRLSEVKGIPYAIEALRQEGVPRRVHLYLIGEGPLKKELRRCAEAAGLVDRVHLLGFRNNIFEYLAHLDLLLMPSRHEGLPYVLLEAWSLGCPLAVSRVGGLAEVVREGPGMTLFTVGAVDEIAASIIRAFYAVDRGDQTVDPCPYTLEAMGRKYLEILEDLSAAAAKESN